MANDHSYKIFEIVGTSSECIEDAINNAIGRCGQSESQLRWFQVTETRGDIVNNRVKHWQVTLKIGFTLEN